MSASASILYRCPDCGLVNWPDAEECKRCGVKFIAPAGLGFQAKPQNFRPYVPPPEAKEPVVRDDGLAWASLMLGLGGFLLFGLSSWIGLICGVVAWRRARRDPEAYGGKGFAIAGVIVSFISAAVLTGGLVWFVNARIAAKQTAKGKPVTWRELLR